MSTATATPKPRSIERIIPGARFHKALEYRDAAGWHLAICILNAERKSVFTVNLTDGCAADILYAPKLASHVRLLTKACERYARTLAWLDIRLAAMGDDTDAYAS
jgi:hypothetical protein